MWVRSRLLEVVLPSTNITFTTSSLIDLFHLLGTGEVSFPKWEEALSSLYDLKVEVVNLYFQIGHDHFVHDVGDVDGDNHVPSHFLVLVLFLQGVARRKVVGEKRERKTEEEALSDYIVSRMKDLREIFSDSRTLLAVLGSIFDSESENLEQELDSLALNNNNNNVLLVPDPRGVVSCIKSGKKLVWKMGSSSNHNTSKAKMATTAHLPGKKMIVLSKLENQILAKNSQTVAGGAVSLHRAKFSNIYLTTWLDSITINKSTSSIILTGPVSNTVKVSGCRNLTIVTLARRIVIQECLDCTFYIFSPTRPVMSTTCHNITFAPFNTNYLGLEEDLARASLGKDIYNEWNNPILMSSTEREIFSLLDPSMFDSLCLPFSNCLTVPLIPLPIEYEMAYKEKQNAVSAWEKAKVVASLSSQESALLESLVRKEYNEYLESFSDLLVGLNNLAGFGQKFQH